MIYDVIMALTAIILFLLGCFCFYIKSKERRKHKVRKKQLLKMVNGIIANEEKSNGTVAFAKKRDIISNSKSPKKVKVNRVK